MAPIQMPFAADSLTPHRFGAKALAQWALASRDEAWDYLVWAGKHPQVGVDGMAACEDGGGGACYLTSDAHKLRPYAYHFSIYVASHPLRSKDGDINAPKCT